jgi:hypothetical protein
LCSIMRPVPFLRSPSSFWANAQARRRIPAPGRNPTRPRGGTARSAARQASRLSWRRVSGPLPPRKPNSWANIGNAPEKTGISRLDRRGSIAAIRPPPETSNALSLVPPYVEPLHRGFKVFDKRRKGPVNGCRTCDQDVVMAAHGMQRDNPLRQRAQAPPCTIAAHGITHPPAGRQTDPRRTIVAGTPQRLQHQTGCSPAPARPGQTTELRAPG